MTQRNDAQQLREAVVTEVERLRPLLTGLSRQLYEHPELSLQETRSAARLQEILAKAGFSVQPGTAGMATAFVASRRGSGERPRIAFLAEYDALPEIGHACGHNIIAAASLGAGLALGAIADRLPGEVMVIGTPAEETVGGKCLMVRAGVFSDVDAALMIHPGSEWRVEVDSLACISLEVTFSGREAHAVAWPERGINALDALIQFYIAVDALRKRSSSQVRIPGVILEGGRRPNIVPARAVGHFTLRAPSARERDEIREAFERAARGVAEAAGCGVSIRATDEPYDDMVTNPVMAALFAGFLGEAGIAVVDGPRPNKGSLDMGNVSRAVPSVHPFIAICDRGTPSHSAAFARATVTPRAEEALMTAARCLALTGLDLLSDPGRLGAARGAFEASQQNP